MALHFLNKKLSSFQIIIAGFLGVILLGTFLLMLPISQRDGQFASVEEALFTSTSAVCVTGLVVRDTASSWSPFGQVVILILIQTGGLGVISVAAFISMISGRKISLLERSLLQDSISAHQIGGIVGHFPAEEYDPVLQQPGIDIIGPFSAVGLFDDHRD